MSVITSVITVCYLLTLCLYIQAIPVNEEMFEIKDGPDGEIKVTEEDSEMQKTIKDLYKQLEDLDVKALYQRRVILEKLLNDTDTEITKHHPKYVVTREEKIFFFTDGAPMSRPKGMKNRVGKEFSDKSVTSDNDGEAKQLEELLEIAKKHTNNPPLFLQKKSSSKPESSSARDDTDKKSETKTKSDKKKLGEAIYSLQTYIDKLRAAQTKTDS